MLPDTFLGIEEHSSMQSTTDVFLSNVKSYIYIHTRILLFNDCIVFHRVNIP